jgi:hypothetical protein
MAVKKKTTAAKKSAVTPTQLKRAKAKGFVFGKMTPGVQRDQVDKMLWDERKKREAKKKK